MRQPCKAPFLTTPGLVSRRNHNCNDLVMITWVGAVLFGLLQTVQGVVDPLDQIICPMSYIHISPPLL